MLDAARRALRAGDTQLALGELDRHQAQFPRGMLGQEATLLRIEVLARSGNRSAAQTLARQFLARQPNSPHAKRIESLLGQASAQAGRR
jgi:outer membrane protein assembly factor BamD (BamD/ComL family)